jgi:hypothetical protein
MFVLNFNMNIEEETRTDTIHHSRYFKHSTFCGEFIVLVEKSFILQIGNIDFVV